MTVTRPNPSPYWAAKLPTISAFLTIQTLDILHRQIMFLVEELSVLRFSCLSSHIWMMLPKGPHHLIPQRIAHDVYTFSMLWSRSMTPPIEVLPSLSDSAASIHRLGSLRDWTPCLTISKLIPMSQPLGLLLRADGSAVTIPSDSSRNANFGTWMFGRESTYKSTWPSTCLPSQSFWW